MGFLKDSEETCSTPGPLYGRQKSSIEPEGSGAFRDPGGERGY